MNWDNKENIDPKTGFLSPTNKKKSSKSKKDSRQPLLDITNSPIYQKEYQVRPTLPSSKTEKRKKIPSMDSTNEKIALLKSIR